MRLCLLVASVLALAAANCAPDATDQTASAQNVSAEAPAPQAPAQQTASKCPTGPNLQEGVVRFFNNQKGFGYIVPAKGGPEVYVHHSALGTLTIKENDHVVFETTTGQNGPVAANIKVCG